MAKCRCVGGQGELMDKSMQRFDAKSRTRRRRKGSNSPPHSPVSRGSIRFFFFSYDSRKSVAARRTSQMLRTDQLFFCAVRSAPPLLDTCVCDFLFSLWCCCVSLEGSVLSVEKKSYAAAETERSGARCTARLVVHIQSLLHLAFFFSFLTTIELSPFVTSQHIFQNGYRTE